MSDHGLWGPVVDGPRKDKSAFGGLPPEVRDMIIAGLDSGQLTLDAAWAGLQAQGHEISRTALATAYQKLRRLRRRGEKAQALTDLVESFRGQPSLEGFQSLAKLLAAQAADALLDDETEGPKTIVAVSRALETMAQMAKVELEQAKLRAAREQAKRDDDKGNRVAKGISRETIDKIEKEVLGL